MIVFRNEGVLELDCVRTMGINVKENDSAIGHFGTGLKYAIAVLLRTGHEITMILDGTEFKFLTKTKEVRSKDFEFIVMRMIDPSDSTFEDEQLAFTTDYGKDWEVWMAFRELACNARDEGGHFFKTDLLENAKPILQGNTIIMVDGNGIEEAFGNRDEIFLRS